MQQLIKALRFKLAPNPTSGLVYVQIECPDEVQYINVYNISGKLLKTRLVNGRKELSFDTSAMPSDTYLVEATGSKGRQTELLKVTN